MKRYSRQHPKYQRQVLGRTGDRERKTGQVHFVKRAYLDLESVGQDAGKGESINEE